MTRYYLEVLKSGISISPKGEDFVHRFCLGDIICINMYSDLADKHALGPYVVLSGKEYYAAFILLDSTSLFRPSLITTCIIKGYLVDITKNVHREEKLNNLGIW
jgi:hypothetical protein